jgi:polyferredoxin
MSAAPAHKRSYSLTKSRRLVHWAVVLGTLLIGVRHILPGESSRGGSFDSFCAFGGLETLLPFLFSGQTLQSTNLLNFAVLLGVLGVSLLAGRAFCGWLCPLGAIQDILARWSRRLLGEKRHIRGKPGKTLLPLRMPAALDRPLRFAKYAILAAILIASLYMIFPPLREFCPVRAVFGLQMTAWLWITLFVFLAGAILVERAWCKYLCPLGAALAIFNRIAPLRPVVDKNHCNNCGRCDIECSMDIQDVPQNLDGAECVRCLECLQTCARHDSLNLRLG